MLLLVGFLFWALFHSYKPLPQGLNLEGPKRPVQNIEFLADVTYPRANGERQIEQQIFAEILAMVEQAEDFLLLDMFLFNGFQGEQDEGYRPLSTQLTEALIQQKSRRPELQVHLITDPLNTVYGGYNSPHLAQLQNAGVWVTLTDLNQLRDSNPIYSSFWRLFAAPFGNSPGGVLPNPFGEGTVPLRSYLALLNFKANHRKLVITSTNGQLRALATSANPHDGSSAHGNVALRFNGLAAHDLLQSELAVLRFSNPPAYQAAQQYSATVDDVAATESDTYVQVLTERAVETALLGIIHNTKPGDKLDIAVFYLSDRDVVRALKAAAQRGVMTRVLLDPNKDAFGREKNGVPNRPVGRELYQAGVNLRWCNTSGEQCHAKWLMHGQADGQSTMVLGSTNFTRRNLHNLNLETSVLLHANPNNAAITAANAWFERRWGNTDGYPHSLDYTAYADVSLWHRFLYRAMELTGISTF